MKETAVPFLLLLLILHQHKFVHATPSIEPCPSDSVQVEDVCKCDAERCSKPPCLSTLTLSKNGTDTPGDCCPIYTCDGCTNDTLIDGKCPCAPGAVLDAANECKCHKPNEKLVNNECVCDSGLCPLPSLCDDRSVPVHINDGCCNTTICIPCPEDSFVPPSKNDTIIEPKCVCYPCAPKKCEHNETVDIRQKGIDFPGKCCDIYECKAETKHCVVGGIAYNNGDTWMNPELQVCECNNGIFFCSQPLDLDQDKPCHVERMVYKHMEHWMEDECSNCTCINGQKRCITEKCGGVVGHIDKPLCPPLECKKVCPNGYKMNKKGCQLCKCNSPPVRCDDLLFQYNISKSELKDILEEHFERKRSDLHRTEVLETTTETITTTQKYFSEVISSSSGPLNKHQTTTTIIEPDISDKWTIIIIAILLILLVCVAACVFYVFRSHSKKGSYDTAPSSSSNMYTLVKQKSDSFFKKHMSNGDGKDGKLQMKKNHNTIY